MDKGGHKVFQAGAMLFNMAQQKVISQHRGNRHGNTDGGGDQRVADGSCHHIQTGRSALGNFMHRVHNA